jgi:hypothetical protein
MLRPVLVVFVVLAATVSAGCLQQSLTPLFLVDETVFDDRLEGTWRCQMETWTFERRALRDKPGKPYYHVQIQRDGQRAELYALTGRIGPDLFVDFAVDDVPVNGAFVGSHLLAVHTFGRVRLEGSELSFDMLDSNWVESAVTERRTSIPYVRVSAPPVDDLSGGAAAIVLNAPPAELRALVAGAIGIRDAFDEEVSLVRSVEAPAESALPACWSGK